MKPQKAVKKSTILMVTDVEDDSLERIVNLAQSKRQNNRWVLRVGVNTYRDILNIIQKEGKPELLLYYAHSFDFLEQVKKIAKEFNILTLDIFDPVFRIIDVSIHEGIAKPRTGRQRFGYLKMVEAIEFAGKHDDGRNIQDLASADLVIIGVSRTSKTPLSLYLANLGLKVANIPIILGIKPPEELFKIPNRKLVGLTIAPTRLWQIRKSRQKKFGFDSSSYSSLEKIEKEVSYAEDLMQQLECLVIDVSEKAVEETADQIVKYIDWEE